MSLNSIASSLTKSSSNKEKVLFVGDTHGDISLINKAIDKAEEESCSKIIQVGDFGYFPNIYPEFINSLYSSIPFYFIDGNHDDHSILPHASPSLLNLKDLGHKSYNFYYISRGIVLEWGDSNILFIGGALSIDKNYRTLGLDWWDNEEISFKDYLRASSYEQVDIIVSHDCPRTNAIKYEDTYSSKAIRELMNLYNPWLLVHGHHHQKYILKEGSTIIKGLGCSEEDMFEVIWV